MRRRIAPEPVPERGAAGEEAMPQRVLWAGRQHMIMAELRESGRPAVMAEGSPYFTVRRRQRADAEAWCAERGISVARSVHGCAEPTAAEVAAGTTRGAGPHWQARLDREAAGR